MDLRVIKSPRNEAWTAAVSVQDQRRNLPMVNLLLANRQTIVHARRLVDHPMHRLSPRLKHRKGATLRTTPSL